MGLNKARLIKKEQLTYDVVELTFKAEKEFKFAAGQFITIKINDDEKVPCFRAYSLSSVPNQENTFDLCVKVVEEGRGSNWLNQLSENDTIEYLGPNGSFLYKEAPKTLFIATGTGVAPFKSMIEQELEKGNKNNFSLLFGVRYVKDIFYKEQLDALAEKNPNLNFTISISRPETKNWKGKTGRVTEHLQDFDLKNTEIYICGLKDMIYSVINLLQKSGVDKEKIHYEKYD